MLKGLTIILAVMLLAAACGRSAADKPATDRLVGEWINAALRRR
ncbi:MAG TPA: hypothetical protein VGN95_11070 [Pyrinomonadaceae bacterium]|nr:hypothetical protein [Pyrinomonadaceae bacterium]